MSVSIEPEALQMYIETVDVLCVTELGRAASWRGDDLVGGIMLNMALHGKTGEELQAWLHEQPEAVAYRTKPPVPSLPTFTNAQLRAFTGQFCGIRIPGLPYREVLFTPAYPIYDAHWRGIIRSEAKKRGTHFPLSLFKGPIYGDHYPEWDGANVNECLRELLRDGLIPVGFAHRDDGYLCEGVDPSLVPIIVPMWECNLPLNNDTARINAVIAATQQAFPQSLCYVHFSSGHAAGGSPESDWWHAAKAKGIVGMLYQDGDWNDPPKMWDRCVDFLIRFGGGYHGWPTGIDFVMFENCAYPAFHQGWSEAQCKALNDYLRSKAPAVHVESGVSYVGDFAGFCNG